ncbi:MAG: 50S ribosomal protein L5 [Candidatus Tectomicrobia bacterium]|uniref:Large ribosomal subunit protein uL5 n=1 Tax=Tectimicrobiota bacterium TaxID=2528274 RepID=A0A932MMZ4_UNCTE|nr:50S ribosomal protein L5 [Candidatus Tectomicrobia bacterium]
MPRMLEFYRTQVTEQLRKEFGYKNVMQVPRPVKVTLNMGLGEAVANASVLENGVNELTIISGQKPVVTRARKSIANFKLRAGMPIGAMVTLRGLRMWDFLDRLVNVALPRVRDFRGLSPKSFDGRGNFSIGIRDQLIFPEIDVDKVDKARGLGVVISTTARTDEEGRALLRLLGVPFRTN